MKKGADKKQPATKKPAKTSTAPTVPLDVFAALTQEANNLAAAESKEKTCFVIMPIGDQKFSEGLISSGDLKKRYTDLIREAIERCRPNLQIVRADEVTSGGGISKDIFQRLMNADYVIADLSFPNPNVYYELGIRHACRPGTITIRDKSSVYRTPFDLSDLRHIEYENTPSGLKALATDLEARFKWLDNHPGVTDNHFLEYAQLTEYQFQRYGKAQDANVDTVVDCFTTLMQYPEVIEQLSSGQLSSPQDFLQLFGKYPDAVKPLLRMMIKSGQLKLPAVLLGK
jgi:hypothetical protein